MELLFETRASDSPWVESVWACRSEHVSEMTSVASETWGLTQGAVRQIGRARTAALLLTSGETLGDVVDKLGYYDEPHLARALRRYVGRTAQQLRAGSGGAIALDPGQHTTS